MEKFKTSEEKSIPTEIILEIGAQDIPIYTKFLSVYERVKQKDISYIVIDNNEKNLLKYKEEDVFVPSGHKNRMVLSDLSALPFDTGSVNEIWLMNVVSLLDYKAELSDYLNEMARVLKENGKIIIGEWYTPTIRYSALLLDTDVSQYGFNKKFYQSGAGLKEYLEKHKAFDWFKDHITKKQHAYFMELTKKHEWGPGVVERVGNIKLPNNPNKKEEKPEIDEDKKTTEK